MYAYFVKAVRVGNQFPSYFLAWVLKRKSRHIPFYFEFEMTKEYVVGRSSPLAVARPAWLLEGVTIVNDGCDASRLRAGCGPDCMGGG